MGHSITNEIKSTASMTPKIMATAVSGFMLISHPQPRGHERASSDISSKGCGGEEGGKAEGHGLLSIIESATR